MLKFCFWRERVPIAAQEELGEGTAGEEGIVELAPEALGRKSEGGEGVDVAPRRDVVAATSDQSHGGAEAEADNDDGEIEFCMEPVEGCRDIGGFCEAFVASFAETCTAKVETENGKAEAPVCPVEDLHGVVDNFVVKSTAAEGVGMTDKSGEARTASAFVEERFEAAGRPAEVHIAKRGGVGGRSRIRGSEGRLHARVYFTRICA